MTSGLCYILKYNVDALNVKSKLYHLSKETKMKRKRKAFVKEFYKSLVGSCNTRFRLDINMLVMVINPGIEFRA